MQEFYISGIYFKENADITKFLEYSRWLRKATAGSFDRNSVNYALFEILAEYKRCGVPKSDIIKAILSFSPLFVARELVRRKKTAKKDISNCVNTAKEIGLVRTSGTNDFPVFEKDFRS